MSSHTNKTIILFCCRNSRDNGYSERVAPTFESPPSIGPAAFISSANFFCLCGVEHDRRRDICIEGTEHRGVEDVRCDIVFNSVYVWC